MAGRPRALRTRDVPRCEQGPGCRRVAHAEVAGDRDRVVRACRRHMADLLDDVERSGGAAVVTLLVYVRDTRAEAHAGYPRWQLHRVPQSMPIQLTLD